MRTRQFNTCIPKEDKMINLSDLDHVVVVTKQMENNSNNQNNNKIEKIENHQNECPQYGIEKIEKNQNEWPQYGIEINIMKNNNPDDRMNDMSCYNNNQSGSCCSDTIGGMEVVDNNNYGNNRIDNNNQEEVIVDVESKYFSYHRDGSGIKKKRRSPKNSFKIIVARESVKRFLKYGDFRSLNDLRALSKNMTREERFSLFNVFSTLVNMQDDNTSSRKDMIIPIIFGMDNNNNFNNLPCNHSNTEEEGDINVLN